MQRPFSHFNKNFGKNTVRDETGSMTIFAMFIFVIILIVGGMAVDIMRYENKRVHLQNTADRAVLAAGSLRQPNDPEEVVREYFRREGLEEYLTNVRIEEGLNFRRVNVSTSDTSPTMFMKFLGVNELTMTPVSASEERYSKVEVSLVLDISGSMVQNNSTRLANLRSAGQDFIDTLYENSEPGQVSVSIIPYAAQVNLGPVFSQYFNISPRLTQSQCVNFAVGSFNTTQLRPTDSLTATGHFDPWQLGQISSITCPTQSGAELVAFSGDPDFLRNRINSLHAVGGTSIEIGVKWGAALLDPAMRPVITEMIADGHISSEFSGRPLAYEDEDALKVLVIMTDGDNFEERQMRTAYISGISPIHRHKNEDRYSIYVPSRNEYYVPHLSSNRRWQSDPYGGFNGSNQLTWDQLWELKTVRWVVSNLYHSSTHPAPTFVDSIQPWQKNERMEAICNAVNARDIPIFTVAFEAGDLGRAAMQLCATSLSHYFDVDGTDIRGAFRAIAGTINRLRLTQ